MLKTPLEIVGDDTNFIAVIGTDNLGFATNKESRPFVAELVRRANAYDALVAVLKGYEALEAKVIMTAECWGPGGMDEYPRCTPEIAGEFLKLQSQRNAALAAAKGGGA